MRPTEQEFANPQEWLSRLAEESDGYRRLVRESGGTGRAAYRLARARCSALGSEPRLEDLQSAAVLLASQLGSGGTLPIKSLLPSAKSAPPIAPSSLVPGAKSAPPAPPSAGRRASKSRSRQAAPTLRAGS
jgi:hypothetical protein